MEARREMLITNAYLPVRTASIELFGTRSIAGEIEPSFISGIKAVPVVAAFKEQELRVAADALKLQRRVAS